MAAEDATKLLEAANLNRLVLYTMRLPAIVVLGIWFALQLLNSLAAPAAGGGVAFRAHLGGFIAGVLLIRLFAVPRPTREGSRW